MAKYSLDLIQEYKVLEKLREIIEFFQGGIIDDRFQAGVAQNKARDIQKIILDKIKKSIRVWGSAILSNIDAEFVLI